MSVPGPSVTNTLKNIPLNTFNKEVLCGQSIMIEALKEHVNWFYFCIFSFVRNFLQKHMIWRLRVLVSYYKKLLSGLFMACLPRHYRSLSDIFIIM